MSVCDFVSDDLSVLYSTYHYTWPIENHKQANNSIHRVLKKIALYCIVLAATHNNDFAIL